MGDRKTYIELLRDPRWQKKRLEILNRSDFHCEGCGREDKTLHVHHRLYRKGAKPWEYADTELDALCENCHEVVTYEMAQVDELLALIPPRLIDFKFLRVILAGAICGFLKKDECSPVTYFINEIDGGVRPWQVKVFISLVRSTRKRSYEVADNG